MVFAMTGVESRPINEAVRDPHLIEFLHLCRHDFFQCSVIHFFEETVIRPVGRQRLHDVEPAVVGNEPVVVQIIHQICDLREANLAIGDLVCTEETCADFPRAI